VQVIKYSTLVRDLGLKDMRTVEDLIIEGMYVGLFSGKLDQKKQEFQVWSRLSHACVMPFAPFQCSLSRRGIVSLSVQSVPSGHRPGS